MNALTPAQVAQRVATTPAQRARELHNIATASAHVAMEDALHRYAAAIAEATRQHADRIRARAATRHHFEVQAHHDRAWASNLYWKATRDVNRDAANAEALLPLPADLEQQLRGESA